MSTAQDAPALSRRQQTATVIVVSSRGVTAVVMTVTVLASLACALVAFTAATAGGPARKGID